MIQILLGEGALTTRDLHRRLPEVAIATLYRQVSQLAAQGLIEVADDQPTAAGERAYRLVPEYARPTPEELAGLTSAEALTAFTVFTSGLIRDFGDYLDAGGADLHGDRVGFAQAPFWASDEEVDALGEALMAAVRGVLGNEPAPGRRHRVLTTVLMPRDLAQPGADEDLAQPGADQEGAR